MQHALCLEFKSMLPEFLRVLQARLVHSVAARDIRVISSGMHCREPRDIGLAAMLVLRSSFVNYGPLNAESRSCRDLQARVAGYELLHIHVSCDGYCPWLDGIVLIARSMQARVAEYTLRDLRRWFADVAGWPQIDPIYAVRVLQARARKLAPFSVPALRDLFEADECFQPWVDAARVLQERVWHSDYSMYHLRTAFNWHFHHNGCFPWLDLLCVRAMQARCGLPIVLREHACLLYLHEQGTDLPTLLAETLNHVRGQQDRVERTGEITLEKIRWMDSIPHPGGYPSIISILFRVLQNRLDDPYLFEAGAEYCRSWQDRIEDHMWPVMFPNSTKSILDNLRGQGPEPMSWLPSAREYWLSVARKV